MTNIGIVGKNSTEREVSVNGDEVTASLVKRTIENSFEGSQEISHKDFSDTIKAVGKDKLIALFRDIAPDSVRETLISKVDQMEFEHQIVSEVMEDILGIVEHNFVEQSKEIIVDQPLEVKPLKDLTLKPSLIALSEEEGNIRVPVKNGKVFQQKTLDSLTGKKALDFLIQIPKIKPSFTIEQSNVIMKKIMIEHDITEINPEITNTSDINDIDKVRTARLKIDKEIKGLVPLIKDMNDAYKNLLVIPRDIIEQHTSEFDSKKLEISEQVRSLKLQLKNLTDSSEYQEQCKSKLSEKPLLTEKNGLDKQIKQLENSIYEIDRNKIDYLKTTTLGSQLELIISSKKSYLSKLESKEKEFDTKIQDIEIMRQLNEQMSGFEMPNIKVQENEINIDTMRSMLSIDDNKIGGYDLEKVLLWSTKFKIDNIPAKDILMGLSCSKFVIGKDEVKKAISSFIHQNEESINEFLKDTTAEVTKLNKTEGFSLELSKSYKYLQKTWDGKSKNFVQLGVMDKNDILRDLTPLMGEEVALQIRSEMDKISGFNIGADVVVWKLTQPTEERPWAWEAKFLQMKNVTSKDISELGGHIEKASDQLAGGGSEYTLRNPDNSQFRSNVSNRVYIKYNPPEDKEDREILKEARGNYDVQTRGPALKKTSGGFVDRVTIDVSGRGEKIRLSKDKVGLVEVNKKEFSHDGSRISYTDRKPI